MMILDVKEMGMGNKRGKAKKGGRIFGMETLDRVYQEDGTLQRHET